MSYATQSDIEDLFGPANVAAWSRFDTGAPTGATDIGRVATAIAFADAVIDAAFLNGPYALPLSGPVCTPVVTHWAAVLAGVWLYGDRATSSYVDYSGNRYLAMRTTVLADIDRYKSGLRRLDAVLRFPQPSSPTPW